MIAQSVSQPAIERTTIYTLPKFLSQIQHITTIETGGLEFIICCDKMKLYIFPLISAGNKPLGNIHQSLPIPNIKSLRTIAKNYLMIETQNKYIGIFQIIKSTSKQPAQKPQNPFQINTVKVEFSEVLKWRVFSCYFVRQVMENLFQVQVFFSDVQFQIFQFTIKNKRGSMSFTISPNGKIQKANKKQLYGSKCFFNIGKKLMYWLKNFSDKQFVIQELTIQPSLGNNKSLNQPFAYFGVQRSEQYKQIYPNLMIRDCINPSKRFALKIAKDSFLNELKTEIAQISPIKRKQLGQQNPFNELVQQSNSIGNISQILQSLKITTFTDMIMIENKAKKELQIYQIKGDGTQLIGKENSQVLPSTDLKQTKSLGQNQDASLFELRRWQWHFGNSKKLIAIDKLGFQLKYIQEISFQTLNQNIIEAQVVNMNEKPQMLKQQTLIEQPAQNNRKNQAETEKIRQDVPEMKSKTQQQERKGKQSESEPKRKISKDQLEKFCQQFKEQDAKKYVSQQLIKKVDEVNNWTKKEVTLAQKSYEHHKTRSFKSKIPSEAQSKLNQQSSIQTGPKNQKSPKQQFSNIQKKPKDQTKPQFTSTVIQQVGSTLKQKPPMKIIQRNKISVAKNFQPENQAKPNQVLKKEQVGKQTQKAKDQIEKEKFTNGATNRSQIQSNQFTKFRVKEESDQHALQEKDKKRFMKNHLSQERKEQNETESHQTQPETIEKDDQTKNENPPKEEKVKFNVITRASLIKKKQAEAQSIKTKQNQTQSGHQNQQQSEIIEKQNPCSNQKKQVPSSVETKLQNQNASEEQKPHQVKSSPVIDTQSQPKTKFIPSIDVGKASKNHLNDCDFLSEDSLSDEQKDQNAHKNMISQENQNEESIEQEIDDQENDELSAKNHQDLEHLIDDDINVQKLSKVEQKIITQQKVPLINQDEQIEKFCNTLLNEQQSPKYQRKQPQSPPTKVNANIAQKEDQNSTPSFNLETFVNLPQKNLQSNNIEKNKQTEDQMAKFNSLLFKTSIKRTNIFSSQNSQLEEKKEHKNPSNDSKELQEKRSRSPGPDSINEATNIDVQEQKKEKIIVGAQKQGSLLNSKNKKSKDWHGSSSDQQTQAIQQNQKQKQIERQKSTHMQTAPANIQEKYKLQQKIPLQKNTKIEENAKSQLNQAFSQLSKPQKLEKPVEIVASEDQPTQKTQNNQTTQTKRNPFYIAPVQTLDKNIKSLLPGSNIFQETSKLIQNQSNLQALNKSLNFTELGSNQTNIFTKKPLPFPLPNLFSAPPPTVMGGSNSNNMFKKFLEQRKHKKNQEPKKQEDAESPQAKLTQVKQTKDQKPKEIGKKTQIKQSLRKKSQVMVIPTNALPQIQQMISKYEESTIRLLEQQQKLIIKSLQQIPQTHNPYNKNNSLLLPQEIKEEIIKQSKLSVKKWLSTKMLDKIEVSFREIMQQHKTVYEDALKFYQNEARKKITTMQLQYEQQSSILMDIENVSANMCAALQSSILQGQELHTYQLKQWKRQIQNAQNIIIDPLNVRIDESKVYFENRNKKMQYMTNELKEIKEILKEKLRKKQEQNEAKEKKKQQKQKKLKQRIEEQAKLQLLRMKEQNKKQSKKGKKIDQNEGHVSFYDQASLRHNEAQYYGRQPYSYY